MKIRNFKCVILAVSVCLGLGACSKSDAPSKTNEPIRPVTATSSAFVDTVFSFTPAPGQFVNTPLADIATVSKITKNETISLGAWGGQIVLGFDHTVLNKKGADLKITGNAGDEMSEAGIVWVMYDRNANGLPDDDWYELKGSAMNQPGYQRNYKITYFKPADAGTDIQWEDNAGKKGVVKANIYHKQSYYPGWISTDKYTLEGSLLPSSGVDSTQSTHIISKPFEFGYADNISIAKGGDLLELDNAIDGQGKAVQLVGIDFIKIQTGAVADLGWVGEFSTELSSVQDAQMSIK